MTAKRQCAKPPFDEDDIEWTAEMQAAARPGPEVLREQLGDEAAAALLKRKPGQRGPQKAPTKQSVTIRLDREVVEFFKRDGKGWQSRINDVLKRVAARGR